jgi:hypothetical protein
LIAAKSSAESSTAWMISQNVCFRYFFQFDCEVSFWSVSLFEAVGSIKFGFEFRFGFCDQLLLREIRAEAGWRAVKQAG